MQLLFIFFLVFSVVGLTISIAGFFKFETSPGIWVSLILVNMVAVSLNIHSVIKYSQTPIVISAEQKSSAGVNAER